MPQIQLPVFPASSTVSNNEFAFEQRDGQVFYFNGHLPVFTHPVDDIASFRFFTSQLIANGSASQGQISRAFGVPLVTVKRACKKLRLEGAAAFFRPTPPRQGHKLTVNLRPDPAAGELRIELHGQANPIHDGVVAHLCEELNATETYYPGTKLRLKYVPLRSSTSPLSQDV